MLDGTTQQLDTLIDRVTDVRGLATPPGPVERIQVFGQWATEAGVIGAVGRKPTHWASRLSNQNPCSAARLWHIRGNSQEVTRVVELAGPLTFGQISGETGEGLPAGVGATRVPKSKLKLVLVLETAAGQEIYFGDLNQPIEVYANAVSVGWAGPAAVIEVITRDGVVIRKDGTAVPQQAGLLVDAIIGVTVEGVEESIGHREWTFTEPLAVAATVQGQIAVPRGAVGVQITQTTAGAASAQWRQFAADPGIGGREIGVIPFLAGQRRSTDNSTPLSDAALLVTDVDAVAARTFSVVWTIRP